jgi:hypothetical protein
MSFCATPFTRLEDAAGFGDTISLGLTAKIRSYTPGASAVDPHSASYYGGVGAGIAWDIAFGDSF